MSEALLNAVEESNIKKLLAAIQKLRQQNIDINDEIFSNKTILDYAIDVAGDSLENSNSKKIIGILREEGAITFLEYSNLPAQEENVSNPNISIANSHEIPPHLTLPPKPPLHPVSQSSIIPNGIASLRKKGGRKTKKKKSKKSRKHLRR